MSNLSMITPREWAAMLAMQLGDSNVTMVQLTSLDELQSTLSLHSREFVVLHAGTVPLTTIFPFLYWQLEFCPDVRTAVVGISAVDHEWAIRDAGAVAVFGRTWDGPPLARMIQRHFGQQPVESPRDLLETLGLSTSTQQEQP